MDRVHGIRALNTFLSQGGTRSFIAKRLGIHPSQVSRIASGQFVRLEGHALRVCKFAHSMTEKEQIKRDISPDRLVRLQTLLFDLLTKCPQAADGLEILMRSLADQMQNIDS